MIKGRNLIAEYVYDDRLSIVVYKINVHAGEVLDSVLVQSLQFARPGWFHRYCAVTPGQLKISYRCDTVSPTKKIIVSFSGDSVSRIFKNRNLVSVKMLLGGLAIQYDKKGPVDLEVEKYRSINNKISAELTFLKRDDAVFLILISPTFNSDIDISGFSRKILNENFFK